MSNEHPDMSGNPADAPYVCEKCEHQFTDDAKLCGSFFNSETILCSQECSVEHDYAIAEKLQSLVDCLVDHIKTLQSEVEGLRAIKFQRFGKDDCWIYQGDGQDHLESLVCPVVVSPQKMMELELAQSRVAELEAENKKLRDALCETSKPIDFSPLYKWDRFRYCSIQQREGAWTLHDGGPCPCDSSALVYVQVKGGGESTVAAPASRWLWDKVTAWRLADGQQAESE